MKPIAFVIPWYGDNIRGGAEAECNCLAHILQEAGQSVEVFTTCVRDAACDRGKNTLPEGEKYESGILVRRFKVCKRNLERFNQANFKIYHNQDFSVEDEQAYFEEDINSPDMYSYIEANKDLYRCFIFIPYMYGPTYNGSAVCMDKAILISCLHDESYAYMTLLKKKMPEFKGIIFLARPEMELAKRLYPFKDTKLAVLGGGVDTSWSEECSAQRFRKKFGINEKFILYAGRKDKGKKADELIEFFVQYKTLHKNNSIKLVLIGSDMLPIPSDFAEDIIDLGFVSTEDKHDALAAAYFLCNPSYFESFSLVIMESWIARRPVLVSEHCQVTANFCLETNGGLYYSNLDEFIACLDYFLEHEDIAIQMGENGYEYVIENFSYHKIAEKYLDFLNGLEL